MGTCNWLTEYVPRLAQIKALLTDLLREKGSFRWTNEARVALERTKLVFRTPLVLTRPIPCYRCKLQTNASAVRMGAALYQQEEYGQRHVISYASAKFSPTEACYHCNEQGCLGLFRPFFEDAPFTLRTDSKVLTRLEGFKDNRDKLL